MLNRWSMGNFTTVKVFCVILQWWRDDIMHLLKPMGYNTQSKAKCKQWTLVSNHEFRLISCTKHTIIMQDVNNQKLWGGWAKRRYVGTPCTICSISVNLKLLSKIKTIKKKTIYFLATSENICAN